MARDAWYEIATKLTASAVEETKLGSRKAEVNICFVRLQNFCQKIFVYEKNSEQEIWNLDLDPSFASHAGVETASDVTIDWWQHRISE